MNSILPLHNSTDLSVYFLAIISGAVIGHLVLRTRAAILFVDFYRAKNPILGPLLGECVIILEHPIDGFGAVECLAVLTSIRYFNELFFFPVGFIF